MQRALFEDSQNPLQNINRNLIYAMIFGFVVALPGMIILIVLGAEDAFEKCDSDCVEDKCFFDLKRYPCTCKNYSSCDNKKVSHVGYVGVGLLIAGFVILFFTGLVWLIKRRRYPTSMREYLRGEE